MQRREIMVIISVILAIAILVSALYGFGVFDTPYMGTFRIVFYFVLFFFLATLSMSVLSHWDQGYDPTPTSLENVKG